MQLIQALDTNCVFILLHFRSFVDLSRRNPIYFHIPPPFHLEFLDDPIRADQWFFAIRQRRGWLICV